MKVTTVNKIKYGKEYVEPHETVDITDKGILKQLLDAGAIIPLEEIKPSRVLKKIPAARKDVIKALTTITVVNEEIAEILYKAKLTSVNEIAECSVAQLKKIKGISPELAQSIYDSFE